ncbi:trehalose-phosphatase [Psychrobacter sp. AH5]|uniref:trehalose-phosphatase n=1 Tax=Psychrobacter sp. AH5 TaxID=2937433 RepID=UPI003342BA41
MTLGRSIDVSSSPRYIPPQHFTDYLSYQQNYALFLDIDGTLAEFTLDPKNSFIPKSTLQILQQIQSCGVKVAIVTGRSLVEARQMLSPLDLPFAATHGLEIALGKGLNNIEKSDNTVNVAGVNSAELAVIKQAIAQSSQPYNELSVENKPYSIALHFREDPTLADVAYNIMTKTLEHYPNWVLKPGKYVWEIVPKGADKGSAIISLLQQMSANDTLCPIFIGDDSTDEAGFIAVQQAYSSIVKQHNIIKGMGIKVGDETSCAHYRVNDIAEVTTLLSSFLRFCQTSSAPSFKPADAHFSLTKTIGGQCYEPLNCLI